jgi:hypothetical protein
MIGPLVGVSHGLRLLGTLLHQLDEAQNPVKPADYRQSAEVGTAGHHGVREEADSSYEESLSRGG